MTAKVIGKFSTVDAAGVVACVVITIAAYFAVARPLLEQQARTVAVQQNIATQRQRAATATNAARAAKAELDSIQLAIASRPLKISPQNFLNQRLAGLTALSAKCGLSIQTLQPGTVVIGTRFNSVPIQLSGRGTYVNCVRYLGELHKQCLDVGVASLKLSGNPEDAAPVATFEFNLNWFALPPNNENAALQ